MSVNLFPSDRGETAHLLFADLVEICGEVAVARLNGARPPEPTDIPLRACNRGTLASSF